MKKIAFYLTLIIAASFAFTEASAVSFDGYAVVYYYEGDVRIIPAGRDVGVSAEEGMKVSEGDWIRTSPGSTITIAFDEKGENVMVVEENTLMIVKLDGYLKVQLLSGDMYAVLEGVEDGDQFRVLTPSVVTESTSSGWGISSDGSFTNVVAFQDDIYVYGLNEDGTPKEEKYKIQEGYQRKTLRFQDPGELEPTGESLQNWFQDQVVAHHLEQKAQAGIPAELIAAAQVPELPEDGSDPDLPEGADAPRRPGEGTMTVDGEEIDIVEYLYRQRLGR